MKVYRKTARVARVEEMEARFDRVMAALDEAVEAGGGLSGLNDDIEALREYLGSGKWQKDFEADRQAIQQSRVAQAIPEQRRFSLLWQYYAKGCKFYSDLK